MGMLCCMRKIQVVKTFRLSYKIDATSCMRLIQRNILLFAISLALVSCGSNAGLPGNLTKDYDWNTPFTSNCPLPNSNSVVWMSEGKRRFARMTLLDGDKGGCTADKVARHSAPYWERAELKQSGTLDKNELYTIDVTLRFVKGFGGERETFFQVHAYNDSCKQAYPPVMIQFDNTNSSAAVLTLQALQSNGHHIGYKSDMRIENVLGKWIDLRLVVKLGEGSSATLYVDEKAIFNNIPIWVESCGTPHVKFGAYRPGNLSGSARSVVDFDSINVN